MTMKKEHNVISFGKQTWIYSKWGKQCTYNC